MFTALWWHDARRGGVGVFVPYETIVWLEELLEDIPIDPDSKFGPDGGQTTAGYIFARMRDVLNAAQHTRNTCLFPRFPNLTESQLVWTARDGYPDRRRFGGRRVYRDPRNLREYNVGFDDYGRRPRASRQVEYRFYEENRRAERGPRRSSNTHGAPQQVLGRRDRTEYDRDAPEGAPPTQRPRHQLAAGDRRGGAGASTDPPRQYRDHREPPPANNNRFVRFEDRRYFNPQGTDDPDARPIPQGEWGVHGSNSAPDTRDFRPTQAAQQQAAVDTGRMQRIRERLHELERQVGPYEERQERNTGGRQPHGRLRGVRAGLFSSGRIPRRESKLRVEQRELMSELDDLEERLEDARRNGRNVPDPGTRNPEFHPWYNRRDDDANDGDGAGGIGGGYNGNGYSGGAGGHATAAY